MATTITKPEIEIGAGLTATKIPAWPFERNAWPPQERSSATNSGENRERPSGYDALQALLAFSALHQQVRQRRALASAHRGFETVPRPEEFEAQELFVLDEVLQLVAERAISITGADGLGIALAENNEIVLRASAGVIKPDVGARIQRDSAFSGACFRTAQIIRCDDTETDERANLYACRQLGARSMVAVPLCGRKRVIGLLEAFSAEPFGFNDSDVSSLGLLAELIVAALKPEDEDRFAQSAQVAEAKLVETPALPQAPPTETSVKAVVEESVAKIEGINQTKPVDEPVAPEAAALPDLPVEIKTEPVAVTEIVPAVEVKKSHPFPWTLVAMILVVVGAALAGVLWWKQSNEQLGDVMVRPEPKITKPAPAAQPSASLIPASSTSNPSLTQSSSADSHANSPVAVEDSGTSNQSGSESAGPQETAKMTRITGIRHWSSADSSTVVLDLEDQVQYEAHRLSGPDRIYFDLHDTVLAAEFQGKTIDVGDSLLSKIRLAQPVSGLTRVVLETKGNSNYSVSLEPNPYRLVVQVRKLGATQSQVNLFPGAMQPEKLAIVVPPPSPEDLQLRSHVPKMRIVVDAGHGGWDLGTVGRRGLLEKDLVLEIAQRLGKLLESRLGADVIFTRKDDNYIPLDERAGIANQSQADLFVSVHANYSDLPSARGVETYYTNFFSAPNAKDLETRPDTKAPSSAVLSAADLHDKIEQSRRLAASVQRSLYGTLSAQNPGLRDRGVKEASYVVLTETAMPGILAEVSFVSSPTDEQKLQSDGYREQIAEALYKGIARYAARSHPVKVASAAK
jgi:N-acetylmuramoyl-L-alanine amidase/putative methionine-R-sulfoxide reductase with GAF domain